MFREHAFQLAPPIGEFLIIFIKNQKYSCKFPKDSELIFRLFMKHKERTSKNYNKLKNSFGGSLVSGKWAGLLKVCKVQSIFEKQKTKKKTHGSSSPTSTCLNYLWMFYFSNDSVALFHSSI